MSQYLVFFRMRLLTGLQYRAAAWAGIATQFAWGGMTLLMFWAFYQNGGNDFPMTFAQLSTYIWLQQAFLSLYMSWYYDNDIFQSITNGNVAVELCRPINLYNMWFVKNVAIRVSRVILRCLPILLFACILPQPFRLSPPSSLLVGVAVIISMILGLMVLVAFTMLIYIATFYTMSSAGIRMVATSVVEFLAGSIIPLPFFPDQIQTAMLLLPFSSIQNTPFQIYNGLLSGSDVVKGIILQAIWFVILLMFGKLLMKQAIKQVVIQGG